MPVAVTSDSDSDVEAASLKEVRDSTSTKKSSMISTDDAMYENRRYSKVSVTIIKRHLSFMTQQTDSIFSINTVCHDIRGQY